MGISAFPQGSLERERPPGGGGNAAHKRPHIPPPPWHTRGPERGGRSLHILPACAALRLQDERARRGSKRRASREAVSPSIQLQRGFPDKDRTTAARAPPSENVGFSEFS